MQRRFRTGRKGKYCGSMIRVIRSTRFVKLPVDVMKPSNVPSITEANRVPTHYKSKKEMIETPVEIKANLV